MLTPEQQQYLRDHRLAALGTGRRDGSPQLTWISYQYDGTDIVLQTGGKSAKARNIRRGGTAAVSLLIPDGGRNLVVYGPATVLEDGAARRDAVRRAPSARSKRRRRGAGRRAGRERHGRHSHRAGARHGPHRGAPALVISMPHATSLPDHHAC
jgi:PPOX class probable F420-dependent enzyme